MEEKIQPEYIFETSWEVCNMVGGIYTVLSTRAATLQKEFGDKLVFIGPDVWASTKCPYFEEDPELLKGLAQYTYANTLLKIRIGRWTIPGKPIAILVDFMPVMARKNDIYGEMWHQAGVNSIAAYGDYDESSMFGYATGIVMESYYKFFELSPKTQIIAHFNEWMTTFGAFYINKYVPSIATVFTTHATSIGRSISGNNKPLYDYLHEYNGDQMAYELNMVSKHSTEKAAAHLCDCFTTVSDITARECTQLLDKQPHVVTPNGFEDDFVPKGRKFSNKRKAAREKLRLVAETLLSEKLDDDALYICTAGRYEYKNKGIDILIEGLKYTSQSENLKKQVVAFIMVPGWIKGHRNDLASCLVNGTKLYSHNRITTHELHDFYNDNVMSALNWFHLFNQPNDRVKVIFVPSYLNGNDGIFNMSYYDLLIGMDLSVFPSYYEPWGYTPLESVAFSVPTITTNLSGFGQWVSPADQNIDKGVGIIKRTDYNGYEVAHEIARMICEISAMNKIELTNVREKANDIAHKALWENFIGFYYAAYRIALDNKNIRCNNSKLNTK